METRTQKRPLNKWGIVAISFMIMAFQYAPGVNLAGLFIPVLSQHFSVSRTAISLAITLSIFSSMLGSLFAGKLLSKISIRKCMASLLILNSGLLLAVAAANQMSQLYVLFILRGFCGAFLSTIPISIAISNWFMPKERGRAIGIATIGNGLGAIILSPIITSLISAYGWRHGFILFAALSLVLVPVVYCFFYSSPAEYGVSDAEGEQDAGNTLSEQKSKIGILSTVFIFSWIAIMLLSGVAQSWNANGAAFLTDLHFSPLQVGFIVSLTSAGSVIGKLVIGFIFDKRGAKTGACCGALLLLGAYLALYATLYIPGLAYLGAVLAGLGISSITLAVPLLTSHLFHRTSFAHYLGFMQVASALGGSIIPILVTSIYDHSGSYYPAWILSSVISVLVAFLFLAAFKFREIKLYRAEQQQMKKRGEL